jgi:hypothetical protein
VKVDLKRCLLDDALLQRTAAALISLAPLPKVTQTSCQQLLAITKSVSTAYVHQSQTTHIPALEVQPYNAPGPTEFDHSQLHGRNAGSPSRRRRRGCQTVVRLRKSAGPMRDKRRLDVLFLGAPATLTRMRLCAVFASPFLACLIRCRSKPFLDKRSLRPVALVTDSRWRYR